MMSTRRRWDQRDERGDTLLEIVVAVAIISVAIVVLVGGLAVAVMASRMHRQHATADAIARSAAECLQDRQLAWDPNGNYSTCAPSGVIVVPTCWGAPTHPPTFAACANGDSGLQKLTVTATQGRESETLTVYKRRT